MSVTKQQIDDKKSELLQKQLLAQVAQNNAMIARNAENTCRGELQVLLIQKQIDDAQNPGVPIPPQG